MPVQKSEYWVRVKVKDEGDGSNPYHVAQSLARLLATEHPGLTFEVAEDKVWLSTFTRYSPEG